MEFFFEFVKIFSVSGMFFFACAFFGKKAIESFTQARVEDYKAKLSLQLQEHKDKLDREADRYRGELDRALTEHRIKFEHLHSDRTSIIIDCYHQLLGFNEKCGDYMSRIFEYGMGENLNREDMCEYAEKFDIHIYDMRMFMDKNSLYFEESMTALLKGFYEQAENFTAACYDDVLSGDFKPSDLAAYAAMLSKVVDERGSLDRSLEPIKAEFRKLLGVTHIPGPVDAQSPAPSG